MRRLKPMKGRILPKATEPISGVGWNETQVSGLPPAWSSTQELGTGRRPGRGSEKSPTVTPDTPGAGPGSKTRVAPPSRGLAAPHPATPTRLPVTGRRRRPFRRPHAADPARPGHAAGSRGPGPGSGSQAVRSQVTQARGGRWRKVVQRVR